MPSTINLVRSVYAVLQQKLGIMGFQKQKYGILTQPLSENVVGWLGLSKAIRRGTLSLEINPVIGVRNQLLERQLAELLSENYNLLVPATFAVNIGYCSPEHKYRSFSFSEVATIQSDAEALCTGVRDYGFSFMRSMEDLSALVEIMSSTVCGITEQLIYRIPVGLFLLNRNSEASSFLNKKLSEIGSRTDPAAVRYKHFSSKLCAMLEKQEKRVE